MELYTSIFKLALVKAEEKKKDVYRNTKIKVNCDLDYRLWHHCGTIQLSDFEQHISCVKEIRKVWKTEGERATGFYKQHRNKEVMKVEGWKLDMPEVKGQNGKDVIL